MNLLINPVNPPKNDGRLLVYHANGRRIIHCYDPSHVIKVLRNNLEKKDLVHNMTKRWQVGDLNNNVSPSSSQRASWYQIDKMYRMDLKSPQRLLLKLSDEHLTPNKYKMKVSKATEIFSNTCGTVMLDAIEEKRLPPHYAGTAQVLLFLNDIFDSLNCSEHKEVDPERAQLKYPVKENSLHFSFWEYALTVLQKMHFVNKDDGKINNRSSVLKKVESTIKGYTEFAKTCFELGISSVNIRYLTL